MDKFFIIALLLPGISTYAMEKEPIAKVASEIKTTADLLAEKKQILKNAHENYIYVLKNNLPDCFENTYKSYQGFVEKFGGDLGEKLINPYLLVAQHIKDSSVQKMVNILDKKGWPVNAEKSIAYEEYTNPNKSISYSNTNPIGYAIQFNNKFLLTALYLLKADLQARVYQKGKYDLFLGVKATTIFQNNYNAFEFAIHEGNGELAQTIFNYDPTIVREGNPLKVAVAVAARDEYGKESCDFKADTKSIFTFVHNLVIKHKPLIDHSLLYDACITYCHPKVTAEMMELGYNIDAPPSGNLFSLFNSTITDKIIDLFKNIEMLSFSAEQVGVLIILMNEKNKFSDKQKSALVSLINENIKVDNPQLNNMINSKKKDELRKSKKYNCAQYIIAASTQSAVF